MRVSTKQKQLANALNTFYQNPVARVSLDLVLSLGLVLFLGVFAVQPTIVTMTELIQEIDEKRVLTDQLGQKAAALSTAQAEYSIIQDKLPLLEEAIPSKPELISSLKIVEKLATDNSIIITAMSVSQVPDEVEPSAAPQQTDLGFSISLTGDYPSIRAFVESLQKYRRLFIVQSVSFDLRDNRGNRTLSARIAVNVPYYK